MLTPSGRTRVAAVIGDPIEHSLSPAIHNAAFAEVGLDWVYVACRVPPGDAAAAVAAMRTLNLGGLSVTMPHKAGVIEALDALSPTAERLEAVNCIYWDGDRLVGDNTDGAGVISALRDAFGTEALSGSVGILGAGGAARAAAIAVAAAGASRVVIANRTERRAEEVAELVGGVAEVGEVAALGELDVVINATPLGMIGSAAGRADVAASAPIVGSGAIAFDLVYHPAVTPWLADCARSGARTLNGLPMLVGQAAVAFRHWTGVAAPQEVMANAVQHAMT